jgi:four helix bundle protein
MGEFKTYKDLLIWQKGISLVKEVYRCTETFPADEKFGLTSQIRRSAVSIPSNIAEGWGRESNASNVQFLKIARGSLTELETQLIIAFELNFIEKDKYDKLIELITEEAKMLNSFIASVKKMELDVAAKN